MTAVRVPQGMVKERTLEFQGHRQGTHPFVWVVVTMVAVGAVVGGLVARA